jgi:hypothetical protein
MSPRIREVQGKKDLPWTEHCSLFDHSLLRRLRPNLADLDPTPYDTIEKQEYNRMITSIRKLW